MILVVIMVALLVCAFLGMEIAWAIGIACLAYVGLSQFTALPTPFALFSQQMVVGVDSFSLLAIPLFIYAGELMNRAGVTQRLVRVASSLVGHYQGGLANVAVTSNFIMSGISGSAMADAAATGAVLLPQMRDKKYPPAFSCAVIASAATVGPIIPPSISFVLLGAIMNLSVGRLFLGGILPGALMFVAMFLLTMRRSQRHGVPREPKISGRERVSVLAGGILPLAAPVFVIGSIVFGIATPTEAAAVAVAYTLVLGALVYRSLSFAAVFETAVSTALISAAVMLTVATSQMFAWITVQEQLGKILTDFMLGLSHNADVLLLLANLILLVLGMFMEPLPLMLILAPVLFPVLALVGVDPIHFGVVFVLNIMIGMITPPIGLNLFIISAIGRVEVMAVAVEALPYIGILILVLGLVTYLPQLTLWLPDLVMS